MTKSVYDLLELELVRVARSMVGIKESGHNKGYWVQEYQKAVDGIAQGEPWCAAFVMWCIRKAEENLAIRSAVAFSMSEIYKSEHCMTIWNKSHRALEIALPRPGSLIIWQSWKNGKQTHSGHIGIVSEILSDNVIKTIEGNTGSIDPREGDGVYEKTRHWRHAIGNLRFKGFLSVW